MRVHDSEHHERIWSREGAGRKARGLRNRIHCIEGGSGFNSRQIRKGARWRRTRRKKRRKKSKLGKSVFIGAKSPVGFDEAVFIPRREFIRVVASAGDPACRGIAT